MSAIPPGIYPGPPTYPDHGGIGAVTRSPMTLQVAPRSILAMTVSPVTPGGVGVVTVGALHGVYPGAPVFPGSFPGHGSDLSMNRPSSTTLVVTPV